MLHTKMGIEKLFRVVIILLFSLIIPTSLFGKEADRKPEGKSESKADFSLR